MYITANICIRGQGKHKKFVLCRYISYRCKRLTTNRSFKISGMKEDIYLNSKFQNNCHAGIVNWNDKCNWGKEECDKWFFVHQFDTF